MSKTLTQPRLSARRVLCPACGAEPGHPCINRSRNVEYPGYLHSDRKAYVAGFRAGYVQAVRDAAAAVTDLPLPNMQED